MRSLSSRTSFRSLAAPALLWLLASLASCGYHPAASVARDQERTIHVPTFISYLGYPELDVFASAYLAERLAAHGLYPTSFGDDADLTLQGILQSANERVAGLSASQTLVTLSVTAVFSLTASSGWECRTPAAAGEATLAIPLDAISETDRLLTLQIATANAIDSSMMEVLLCMEQERE